LSERKANKFLSLHHQSHVWRDIMSSQCLVINLTLRTAACR